MAVWYDDPLTVTLMLLVVIVAIGTVIFVMRRYSKPAGQEKKQPPQKQTTTDPAPQISGSPFSISKSVQATMANNAKNELRMLDLERDILGDAIRKLYEAQADGKITEEERDRLAASYKQRMNDIKESIAKDEGIVALHELEGMQEDLMKLFRERFGELNSKVEELRTRIDVKPIREIPIKAPPKAPTQIESEEEETETAEEPAESGEEKPKKKRKPAEEKPDQKTEAEKRIESITSEVEKVLNKLGQMEIES